MVQGFLRAKVRELKHTEKLEECESEIYKKWLTGPRLPLFFFVLGTSSSICASSSSPSLSCSKRLDRELFLLRWVGGDRATLPRSASNQYMINVNTNNNIIHTLTTLPFGADVLLFFMGCSPFGSISTFSIPSLRLAMLLASLFLR